MMGSPTLLVLLLAVVSGIAVQVNETQNHGETNDSYHNNITIQPQVSINVSLLLDDTLEKNKTQRNKGIAVQINETQNHGETSLDLPHNSSGNITLQINETLFDKTLEANVTREDNESFQDQETYHGYWACNTALLDSYGHKFCGQPFHAHMSAITQERWCDLKEVILPYNSLSLCLEELSEILLCYYPNPQTQAFFLGIHETYFHSCLEEEEVPRDAPAGLVLALTLFPVSLIPVLVFMTVRMDYAYSPRA